MSSAVICDVSRRNHPWATPARLIDHGGRVVSVKTVQTPIAEYVLEVLRLSHFDHEGKVFRDHSVDFGTIRSQAHPASG